MKLDWFLQNLLFLEVIINMRRPVSVLLTSSKECLQQNMGLTNRKNTPIHLYSLRYNKILRFNEMMEFLHAQAYVTRRVIERTSALNFYKIQRVVFNIVTQTH